MYCREGARRDTAAAKLLLLGPDAMLTLRNMREPLDPDRLEAFAHRINDIATEARRRGM